jgi:NADH-quinone oxidoreductase subunit M
MQFIERFSWIPALDAYYYLGIDGISAPLILLTTFITPLVVLTSWDVIKLRPAQFFAAFLILEGLMIGVMGWRTPHLCHVEVLPVHVPRFRVDAGCLHLPVRADRQLRYVRLDERAIRYDGAEVHFHRIFARVRRQSSDVAGTHVATGCARRGPNRGIGDPGGHHVEVVRLSLPMVPDGSAYFAGLVIALSLIAIVYIGFVALMQRDMKKLIAYSSIAHMGFVTLGFFLFWSIQSGSGAGLGVGVLYDRVHSRQIADYGGVANTMPIFAAFMVLFSMANAGLPGTSGFVGEFMVIIASFKANFWFAFLAASTLVLGAAYTLWMVKRVIYGEVANDKVAELEDLNMREFAVLAVLAVAVLLIGLWPAPLVDMMNVTIDQLIQQIGQSKL